MTSDSKKLANRKLRWLWISLILYLLFMFVALHYASTVPYQVLALGGLLNMAILFTFIFAIRRVYLRSRGQIDLESSETGNVTSSSTQKSDRGRLRWLWVGAVIAFLTCLNAIAYVRELSHQAVTGILILYAAIATAFVLELRRVYKRLRQ
jgi:hypothetical protein